MRISLHRLSSLALFVQVVQLRSFSAAAKELGLSKSVVSRRISQLETYYGTQLMIRTPRGFSLTEAGAFLAQQCARLLQDAEEAEKILLDQSEVLRGTLRINAPITLAHMYLTQAVCDFMKQHPHLRIELTVTDAFVDLFTENVDIAIRVAKLADSSLKARKIARDQRVVFASPAYLAQAGIPKQPEDLLLHQCICSFINPREEWRFQGEEGEYGLPIQGRFVSNNGTVLKEAVLQGLGLARLPLFMVINEIKAGTLQVVLENFQVPPGGIYALFAHNTQPNQKIERFVDFLVARFRSSLFE